MSKSTREIAIETYTRREAHRQLAKADEPHEVTSLTFGDLADVLEHLPVYSEVTLTFVWRQSGPAAPIDLMVRDFPGPGRRFTNLTSGTEWTHILGIFNNDPSLEYVVAHRRGDDSHAITASRP